ncbi:Alpha carbonic anhydrase [Cinara cedri]|uniref:Alpha carbonic anhydrase n=1 Tax=Cinara cedri TaxID=506608 RepID=A0A5E4N5I6_9HEMI|nr:Alpha carbonic anhydrase [Cinara cedri]
MTDTKTESDNLSINTWLEEHTRTINLDDGIFDSYPLDIGLADLKSMRSPPLMWSDFDQTPSDMTILNTGSTLDIQTEFDGKRPVLTGSVLPCPYEFRSYRFHWGAKNDEGGEHRVMGKQFPMEIHLVFHSVSQNLHTDEVLDDDNDNNMLILVYLCKLEPDENAILNDLVSNLENVKNPGDSTKIKSFSLCNLFDRKIEKYLMYLGRSDNNDNIKPILWMIIPKKVSISKSQLSIIRSLEWLGDKDITSNCQPRSGSLHRFKLYNVTSQADCAVEYLLKDLASGFKLPVSDNRDDRPEEEEQRQTTMIHFQERDDNIGPESPTTPTIDTMSSQDSENTICETDERVELVLEFRQDETDPQSTPPLPIISSPLSTDKKIHDEDTTLAKDTVICSIDSLLSDLSDSTIKTECSKDSGNRIELVKSRREGVRMNSTSLKREMYIKNKLQEQLNGQKK